MDLGHERPDVYRAAIAFVVRTAGYPEKQIDSDSDTDSDPEGPAKLTLRTPDSLLPTLAATRLAPHQPLGLS